MVFSSYEFVLVFLPITLLVYFALGQWKQYGIQRAFLLAASLFFYGYYNWYYLILITVSIVLNYAIALCLQHKHKRVLFVLGILLNVGLLGYFKYYDFFVENINAVCHTTIVIRNILLPLGISFFTFQQLSFLCSVYKEEETVGSLWDYAIFVAFFPQLVAGPIVLYSEMIPQFRDVSRRRFSTDNFGRGLYCFCIGLFKKSVIADMVAVWADNGFELGGGSLTIGWITAIAYTMQIYFDFSGYSDMAIGLAKMFNIDIPDNFDSPYKAKSVTEFWRKWHITLGRALSTYIYKPLGGNRRGIARTSFNLLITFLISGLWHGAAWTFVLWGGIYGLFMVLERLVGEARLSYIPIVIRRIGTFLVVNALWVLFRAESVTQALGIYKGMFMIRKPGFRDIEAIAFDGTINFPFIMDAVYVLGVLMILLWIVWTRKSSKELKTQFSFSARTMFTTVLCLFLSLICISRGSVFIYFNF